MMKTRRALPALLTVIALALVAAPVAVGQEEGGGTPSGPEAFNGTWRYSAGASHGRNIIERAITRAVDGMNFITQPIATGRLRDKNPLVRSIQITCSSTICRVIFDGNRTYRGALNAWTNHTFDGDTVRVQFRHRGDSIVQLFRTDSGTRRNIYRMLPDGRMRLEVTVQSGSLPRDMTYRLVYRR